MRGPGPTESNRGLATGPADAHLVVPGVMVATATAATHRRPLIPDDGPNASGANAAPTLTVLEQARELTAERRRSEGLLLASSRELAGPSLRPRPKEQHV